jgi:hypothetical protein
MGSNDNQTLKRLTPVVFLIATLLLVLGIFLSLIIPAQAQTTVPTMAGTVVSTMMTTDTPMMVSTMMTTDTPMMVSTIMPTAMSTSAGANPGMGGASRTMLISSDLTNWSVVDRNGAQVGTVNGLILDMRGANVCALAPAATPTASASGGAATSGGIANCSLPGGNTGQTSGLVHYIAVDHTMAAAPSGATPTAAGASSGNLIPVPWSFLRFDPVNHVVIVDAAARAFDNAPNYTSNTMPDLFTEPTNGQLTTFWNTPANLTDTGIPNTGGAGSPNQTVVPTTAAATAMPTDTSVAATVAAATAMPTATTASSGAAGPTVPAATVPATVAAPSSGSGTPTAVVPVTGIDLGQASDAAAVQSRIILDVGIVVVGLGVLVLGLIFRSRKS